MKISLSASLSISILMSIAHGATAGTSIPKQTGKSVNSSNEVLAFCTKLVESPLLTREGIESIAGSKLTEAQTSNPNVNVFEADGHKRLWKSLEVRLPKSKGGVFLIVELLPSPLTSKELTKAFGEPSEAKEPYVILHQPPTGQMVMKQRHGSKTLTWILTDKDEVKTLIINDGR